MNNSYTWKDVDVFKQTYAHLEHIKPISVNSFSNVQAIELYLLHFATPSIINSLRKTRGSESYLYKIAFNFKKYIALENQKEEFQEIIVPYNTWATEVQKQYTEITGFYSMIKKYDEIIAKIAELEANPVAKPVLPPIPTTSLSKEEVEKYLKMIEDEF